MWWSTSDNLRVGISSLYLKPPAPFFYRNICNCFLVQNFRYVVNGQFPSHFLNVVHIYIILKHQTHIIVPCVLQREILNPVRMATLLFMNPAFSVIAWVTYLWDSHAALTLLFFPTETNYQRTIRHLKNCHYALIYATQVIFRGRN